MGRLAGRDDAGDRSLAVIAGVFCRYGIVLVGEAGVVDRYLDAPADEGFVRAAAEPEAALVCVDEIAPDAVDRTGQKPLDPHRVGRDEFAERVHGFLAFLSWARSAAASASSRPCRTPRRSLQ